MAAVEKIPANPSVTCGASVAMYPNNAVTAVAANVSPSITDPRPPGSVFSTICPMDTANANFVCPHSKPLPMLGLLKLMKQHIGYVALVVRDYDEAIAFYTKTLRFDLIEDTPLGGGKRWVLLAPPNSRETHLLLARASTPEQQSRIGNQTGGRVFLFLHTDDFWRDYHELKSRDVIFHRDPKEEPYGTVAVFEDLYGNKWDLLQLKKPD